MSKISFPGGGGGGGGVSDHGGLAGLGDNDHSQYLLRSDFAASGAADKPTTSGAVVGAGTQVYVSGIPLGDRAYTEAEVTSLAEAFVEGGAADPASGVNVGAATQLYVSGVSVGDYLTTKSKWQVPFSTYIDTARNAHAEIHGGVLQLNNGDALSATGDLVVPNKGVGKFFLDVRAGSDLTGTITVTGRSVDRNTGAEVEGDTDTISIDGLSTDNAGTDGGSNVTHAWGDVYFTSKWFRGACMLTTADVNLSDLDVWHCSFEQCNDVENFTLTTFDVNTYQTNSNGELYAHLYKVQKQQDSRFTVSGIADLEIGSTSGISNQYYRLRRGNIGVAMSGQTDGFFLDYITHTSAFTDNTIKVWATCTGNL